MAKINSKKSSRFSLFRTGRSKVKKAKQMGIINAGIAVMSVLLFAFIFSFSSRQSQSGVPIRAVTFPTTDEVPKLATEIYEANPILDIEVEILNGCGEPGIAARFSEFLRDKRVDVVRSENCLLYTSPSPRDRTRSRMPSSA